jgi:hypothetical protein
MSRKGADVLSCGPAITLRKLREQAPLVMTQPADMKQADRHIGFAAEELWGLDPHEDIVRIMIAMCRPAVPVDPLFLQLALVYPEVGPLQVHVPPETLPESPEAATGTVPNAAHQSHSCARSLPPSGYTVRLPGAAHMPVSVGELLKTQENAVDTRSSSHPADALHWHAMATLSTLDLNAPEAAPLAHKIAQMSTILRRHPPETMGLAKKFLAQHHGGQGPAPSSVCAAISVSPPF